MITIFVIKLNKAMTMGFQEFDNKLKKAINILIGILILIGLIYLFIFFLKIALIIFVIGVVISGIAYLFNNGNGPPWLNK